MNAIYEIDWALLRQQKQSLLEAMESVHPSIAEDLDGILHLIDHIQDAAAADSRIGIKQVFGEETDQGEATC